MLRRTPQLDEDLIKARVRRPGGPAVNDTSGLLAAHGSKQFTDQSRMDNAQRRLDTSKNRFDKSMGLRKDQFDYNKGQTGLANLISVGNLGLGAYGMHQQNKMTKDYNAQTESLIAKLKARGGANDEFQALFLERLRRR